CTPGNRPTSPERPPLDSQVSLSRLTQAHSRLKRVRLQSLPYGEASAMAEQALVRQTGVAAAKGSPPLDGDCTLVIFGASGDLTQRLLMPAIYNLACDGLLPRHFAIVGVAKDEMSSAQFRDHLTAAIQKFKTRPTFDPAVWDRLAS